MQLSNLYQQESKSFLKGLPHKKSTSLDDYRNWPEEWKTTYYKEYPRATRVYLSSSVKEDIGLLKILSERSSKRVFSRKPISKPSIGNLLAYSVGKTSCLDNYKWRYRRSYPSGGARFPIETYLLFQKPSTGVKEGLYHYNVRQHSLEYLSGLTDFTTKDFFYDTWIEEVPLIVLLTGVFWKNQNKYGEYGYRHILLEAGHIGQNIHLVSQSLGLKSSATSGFCFNLLEDFLDIDGVTESVLYAFGVGE